jgi:murein DD-endopeptidase MepM/ murein hydrolase activator NlpD
MENAMVRYRYAPKRQYASRRRRRAPGQGGGKLRKLIVLQTMVCIVLLLIIMIARCVNTTAANFITDQVSYVLRHDIEFESILSSAERLIADIRNKIVPERAPGISTGSGALKAQDSDEAREEGSGLDKAETRDKSYTWSESTFPEGGEAVNTGKGEADETADAGNSEDGGVYRTGAFPETSVLSANSVNGAERVSDMVEPVEGTLATPFGETRDAVTGNARMHMGVDIDTEPGSDVKAVLDGEITETGSSPEYGGYVEIRHYNGLRTVYANCYETVVNKGTIVRRGDVIARTGKGMGSAGSHLHFEVWDGEYAMDPLDFISVPAE